MSLLRSWQQFWAVRCSGQASQEGHIAVLIQLATLATILNSMLLAINYYLGLFEYLRMNLAYLPYPLLSLVILKYKRSPQLASLFFCGSAALHLLLDIYLLNSMVGPSPLLAMVFPILSILLCGRKAGLIGSLLMGLGLACVLLIINQGSAQFFRESTSQSLLATYALAYLFSTYCAYHFQTFQDCAHKEAARSLRQMHSIIESMGDGLNVLTPEGKFLIVNQKSMDILGYDPRVYDTKNQSVESWGDVFGIFKSDGKSKIESHDLPAMRAFRGEVVENESVFVRNPMVPDGVHLSVTATPMYDDEGHVEAAVLAFRDIGATIQKEQELQKALHVRSIFVANMSHEIRTPMNGIIGAAELLSSEKLSQRGRENLHIIEKSGSSLTQILNDILLYSKLEAGKVALDPKPIKIWSFCLELGALYKPKNDSRVSLHVAVEPEDLKEKALMLDEIRLGQILGNILSNALKFTKSGRVDFSCRGELASEEMWDLTFEVIDTGIGIAPDKLSHIFLEFEQSDTSTTRQYGGTGLGLAISRQLSELMEASLSVSSEVGKGSTFTLKLGAPIKQEVAHGGGQPEAIEQSYLATTKVLVVDDNDVNRCIIEQFLNTLGISPHLVENGQQAIDACKHRSFDVIFMDCQMPVLDGYQATKEIRCLDLKKQPYIIALTAHAFESDKQKCLNAGMDEYLAKPVRKATIHDTMIRCQGVRGGK